MPTRGVSAAAETSSCERGQRVRERRRRFHIVEELRASVANPRAQLITPVRLLGDARGEAIDRYLARFALADLFLDSLPFGSHTTVNDALFAGLPVVTVAGRSFASRASASQLHAVGLPGLVANSLDEYVESARSLATAPDRLAQVRDTLAGASMRSPLFDMHAYTRAFEAAVLDAYETRVRSG